MVSKKTQDRYKERHWGLDGSKVTRFHEPALPDSMEFDEMGRLGEIGTLSGQAESLMLQFSDSASLVMDDQERLYCMLTAADRKIMRSLWKGKEAWELPELAAAIGGSQNQRAPYPGLRVQPLGPVEYVIYYTAKADKDDAAFYQHDLGEDGGVKPWVAVDSRGGLWWAGGDYTVKPHGIIN